MIYREISFNPEYLVSDVGIVWSTKTNKPLSTFKNNKGYYMVGISDKGVTKHYLVHRLVAEAFIPNPENKPVVDHINTIKTDNRVVNLRWSTRPENQNNPISLMNFKISHSKPVCQCDLNDNVIKVWESGKVAAKELNLYASQISGCCRGKEHFKTCGGFKWHFL